MEATTVSPSAISPTEGDDLCEKDDTSVAIHTVALLISLCGLVGNGAVLCLLRRKWRITCIFVTVFGDFFFLLFAIPSSLLFLLEVMSCSPIMSLGYLSFLFQLSMHSYNWGLFWVTYFSIEKDMDFLCSLCCRCHLNEIILPLIAPFFFIFSVIIFLFTTFTSPSQEQGYYREALTAMFAVILLVFSTPVVISSTIHLVEAKRGSQQQQPKRFNIVILLIVLFILPLALCNFLRLLNYIDMTSQVVFLFACINSSIKSFICFLVGTSWRHCSVGRCWRHCTVGSLRDSLRRVFEEPQENTPSRNDATMDTAV